MFVREIVQPSNAQFHKWRQWRLMKMTIDWTIGLKKLFQRGGIELSRLTSNREQVCYHNSSMRSISLFSFLPNVAVKHHTSLNCRQTAGLRKPWTKRRSAARSHDRILPAWMLKHGFWRLIGRFIFFSKVCLIFSKPLTFGNHKKPFIMKTNNKNNNWALLPSNWPNITRSKTGKIQQFSLQVSLIINTKWTIQEKVVFNIEITT